MYIRKKMILASGVLIGYWILIFLMTHLPLPTAHRGSRDWIPHFDKLVHCCLYFGLTCLLLTLFWSIRKLAGKAIPLTVACVVVYGVLDELLQAPIPSRSADPFDFLADLVGATVGMTTMWLLRKLLQSRQSLGDSEPQPQSIS